MEENRQNPEIDESGANLSGQPAPAVEEPAAEVQEPAAEAKAAAEAEPAAEAESAPEVEPAPEVEERDATLEDEPVPAMSADELQDSILEDSGMNAFQKYCARMDDAHWTRMQRIVGALMGAVAGVCLFWDTLVRPAAGEQQQGGIFSIPLVLAIVIALIGPNIIEKQSLRRVPKLRYAMVIALALVIVIYFVVVGAQSGFKFSA